MNFVKTKMVPVAALLACLSTPVAAQIREYGPTSIKQFEGGSRFAPPPSNQPSGAASELVRAVLIGTNGSGTIDKVYVLSDIYLRTSTIPMIERRDFRISKATWSGGSIIESASNLYDYGSSSDYIEYDELGQWEYKTEGLDRLGGAVLDSAETYIYTVGACNNENPTDRDIEFVVSRFNASTLALDGSHKEVVGSGWQAAEGNAIAIDPVRNRLFVAGARKASGSRDFVIAEFDLSQASWPQVGSPYVISRTGDDVAYFLSVHNVNSTTTKIFVSGKTDTGPNGAGPLTFGLTETNSGTWTENWRHEPPSTGTGALRNAGLTVSSNATDVYVIGCEGDTPDDYWMNAYRLNGAGSGTITATWSASVGMEPNPGNLLVASENVSGGFHADGSGNLWMTWTAYREFGSNSYDIRVKGWSNTGTQLMYAFYNNGNQTDLSFGAAFDPRSGQNKFYIVGATTSTTNKMHAGMASTSGLTYPVSQPSPNPNQWSPATSPWTGSALPLTGTGMTAIKGGTGLTFNGVDGRTYNCLLALVRPNRASMDSWEEGTEDSSEIRKYRYHAYEVTLFGIN